MARQIGIMPSRGTIDNVTFYKTQDGFLLKGKSGVTKKRILKHKKFMRTRENMAEFAVAARAGRTLRGALTYILNNGADNRIIGRIVSKMMQLIKLDTTNARGKRGIPDSQTVLLEGFEFNTNSHFANIFTAPYTPSIDRTTGAVAVNILSFIPVSAVAAPSGATHLQVLLVGAAVDFKTNKFTAANTASPFIPWDTAASGDQDLTVSLPAASLLPLFMAVGVAFFEEVNGVKYPLLSGAFNASVLVQVNTL